MIQRSGMVEKNCFVYNSTDKGMEMVYSLFDFCAVGLGLCLDASLPCAINDICSPSLDVSHQTIKETRQAIVKARTQ